MDSNEKKIVKDLVKALERVSVSLVSQFTHHKDKDCNGTCDVHNSLRRSKKALAQAGKVVPRG